MFPYHKTDEITDSASDTTPHAFPNTRANGETDIFANPSTVYRSDFISFHHTFRGTNNSAILGSDTCANNTTFSASVVPSFGYSFR